MELNDEEWAVPLPDRNPFGDKEIRHEFITRVFNLIFMQLAVIIASACVTITLEDIMFQCRHWIEKSQFVMYLFLTASFVYILLALSIWAFPAFTRYPPVNSILFSAVTITLAIVIATACALFRFETISLSLLVTVVSCACFQTLLFNIEYELRSWRGVLSCFFWPIVITLMLLATPVSSPSVKIIAGLVAALFTFFVMFDTDRIMSRAPRIALSPEEHLTGTLHVSTDIIVLILFIPVFLCTSAAVAVSMLLEDGANTTCVDATQVCIAMCRRPRRDEDYNLEDSPPRSDSGIAVS